MLAYVMIMKLFLKFYFIQEDRYSDAVKRLEFDMQLGPYALNQYGDWIHLSNFITKDTVDRLGRYYNVLMVYLLCVLASHVDPFWPSIDLFYSVYGL